MMSNLWGEGEGLYFAENILKKLFDDVFPQFLRVEVGETRLRSKSILLNCDPNRQTKNIIY